MYVKGHGQGRNIKLDARGPHVEPICQSIYKYNLLPLSVTFNIDSHWFKRKTTCHRREIFYLSNIKIRQRIVYTKLRSMTLTFDLELCLLYLTHLLIRVNIFTNYHEDTTISCEVMAHQV